MPEAAVLLKPGTVSIIKTANPGPPSPQEIVLDMRVAPINPADLLIIAGNYGIDIESPAQLGAEGVGIVSEAGLQSGFAQGDLAMPLVRGCWVQRWRLPAMSVVKVPPGLSLTAAASLRINPATARRLLLAAPLAIGDFVIQNAANSMVGRCVARLSAGLGLRCCSIVRRIESLAPCNGEVVVQDGPDLAARVAAATHGAPIRLALDCVAGEASGHLAACLAQGGTLIVFGHLSGAPCSIPSTLLTARDLRVRGFTLRPAEAGATYAELADFYHKLAAELDGLTPPIAATYRLCDVHAALRHAAAPGRVGKVMLDLS